MVTNKKNSIHQSEKEQWQEQISMITKIQLTTNK